MEHVNQRNTSPSALTAGREPAVRVDLESQPSLVCMKFCSQRLSRPVLFWAATWSPLAGSRRRAGACSRQRPRQTTCSLTLTAVKEPRTEIFKVPDRRTSATKVPAGTGIT